MKTRLPTPKKAREAKGVSIRALAKLSRVGFATICRAERSGRYPVTYPVRAAYLAALGLAEPAART